MLCHLRQVYAGLLVSAAALLSGPSSYFIHYAEAMPANPAPFTVLQPDGFPITVCHGVPITHCMYVPTTVQRGLVERNSVLSYRVRSWVEEVSACK